MVVQKVVQVNYEAPKALLQLVLIMLRKYPSVMIQNNCKDACLMLALTGLIGSLAPLVLLAPSTDGTLHQDTHLTD